MIPYIESTTIHLGPIVLQTWGLFVALGILVAIRIASVRAKRLGWNHRELFEAIFWILLAGLLGAKFFAIVAYESALLAAHPWQVLDPRYPAWSMFGGWIGAFIAFWVKAHFYRWHVLSYADVLAFGLPWGVAIGRLGCFFIHDHPGTQTSFFLGVLFPDGIVHHDLGLYLALIGLATGLLFLALNRRPRKPGFWLGLFAVIEGVSRFFLDFLRIHDTTYAGLTPAQYLSVPLMIAGIWLLRRAYLHQAKRV